MEASKFLDTLGSNSSKSLIFDFAGQKINKGYHVTEFKAINVNSVDCGAKANAWNELVLHLTSPSDETNQEYMSAKKFLAIYSKVATVAMSTNDIRSIDNYLVRVEFANEDGIAINYVVDNIEINDTSLVVKSLAPGTTCKAIDYVTGNVPIASNVSTQGCC